jgi:hypothetical protein
MVSTGEGGVGGRRVPKALHVVVNSGLNAALVLVRLALFRFHRCGGLGAWRLLRVRRRTVPGCPRGASSGSTFEGFVGLSEEKGAGLVLTPFPGLRLARSREARRIAGAAPVDRRTIVSNRSEP